MKHHPFVPPKRVRESCQALQCQVFIRLKMWNNFFSVFPRFREKLGVKTVKALKRNNNGVTHAAIDMLCALMCVSTTSSTSSTCVFLINKAMSLVLTDLDPLSLFLSALCFACSPCTTTTTWGRSSWTKPLCCLQRSSWKISLKNSSLTWWISASALQPQL